MYAYMCTVCLRFFVYSRIWAYLCECVCVIPCVALLWFKVQLNCCCRCLNWCLHFRSPLVASLNVSIQSTRSIAAVIQLYCQYSDNTTTTFIRKTVAIFKTNWNCFFSPICFLFHSFPFTYFPSILSIHQLNRLYAIVSMTYPQLHSNYCKLPY